MLPTQRNKDGEILSREEEVGKIKAKFCSSQFDCKEPCTLQED